VLGDGITIIITINGKEKMARPLRIRKDREVNDKVCFLSQIRELHPFSLQHN
jgi:hypothetical protein